jgi:glycosyltransferase involved in cell wall biosynthesis
MRRRCGDGISAREDDDVKVLVFTTVFPNPAQPLHGLFVAERVRSTTALADVRVVSPVAWFRRRRIPDGDAGPPPVEYPTFFYLPGLFKSIDGLLLFISALPRVLRLRRWFDFDLIDAHFGYPDGVAAILIGRWCGRPVTVTLRGSEVDMAQRVMRRAAMAWGLRRAVCVIAVSPQLADLALSLGVAAERVKVIGNGVDASRFQPTDRAAARQRLGIPDAAPLIVSVGHLARVKRFERVVRALATLTISHPAVRLAVVGGAAPSSGSYPAELDSEIERLNLSERVTVTGPVPPDEVAVWLSAADVFVLASEREGSSNALREAIACGCPVITTNVGDAGQIVRANSGVILESDASPEQWRATLDAALRRTWDRAAIRASASRFTWSEVGSRVAAEWQACRLTTLRTTAAAGSEQET